MTGRLSKNFHGVGIGPLSKILAVKSKQVHRSWFFDHFWSIQNQNKKKSRITAELYSSQLIKLTNKWHIYSFRKCVWRIIHRMVKDKDKFKTLWEGHTIWKKNLTLFLMVFSNPYGLFRYPELYIHLCDFHVLKIPGSICYIAFYE